MSDLEASANRRPREFVCRVATGDQSGALSGVWRIWAARNQPDLFIAIRSLGGHIKAAVHCPREGMPTWKRHFGFVFDAKGDVAEAVRAAGGSRHKVTWSGAELGPDCWLEWRIFMLATALEKIPRPVSSGVTLVPPPTGGQCLVFAVIIGPAMPTSGYPRMQNFDTHLVTEGRLSDGRRVWVVYCYTLPGEITFPQQPSNLNLRAPGSVEEIRSAARRGELRAFAVSKQGDGSLGFWDVRVEQRQ
jgi:hypothetical protein